MSHPHCKVGAVINKSTRKGKTWKRLTTVGKTEKHGM